MGKPYSDLEKRAIAILAGGGNPATSQDEAVKKYWTWKINPSAATHKLPASSKRPNNRKKDDVAIIPFSIAPVNGVLVQARMTKRTTTALGGDKTACGHQDVGTNRLLELKNFQPAYVYWRTGEAATSADRTSRITGRTYKSYYTATDEGFMAPFGRLNITDATGQAARQSAIKTAIAGETINLITFTPEKYRG